MAINISSPNPIKASDISKEFGPTTNISLGNYRAVNQNVGSLSNLPLDTGIPQSGEIKFSHFYGKRLNIVVNLYDSIADNSTRLIVRDYYNSNYVTVIGGFKSTTAIPLNGSGSRIIANVNKIIGSEKTVINYCALRTGTWATDANLEIVIGSSGGIYGAGGNGGAGGYSNGQNAGQGTSALGIQHPTRITNQGTIFGGIGGGGGGSGGSGDTFRDVQGGQCRNPQSQSTVIAGGGGAGGRGLPGGEGGGLPTPQKSSFATDSVTLPTAGTAGNTFQNGQGGSGGSAIYWKECSQTATSGGGGAVGSTGGAGNYGTPGQGGQRGYSILVGSGGSLLSISGNNPDPNPANPVSGEPA
jgi:hypothetical protein